MYLRSGITIKRVGRNSKWILLCAFVWSLTVFVAHEIFEFGVVSVPGQIVTNFGVVLSLYLGFKSSSAYNRWWEARKIWGEIINTSRSFANHAINLTYRADGTHDKDAEIRLVKRHLAWVYALAHQLRKKSKFKASKDPYIFDFRLSDTEIEHIPTSSPEYYRSFLSEAEVETIDSRTNPAAQILLLQGADIKAQRSEGNLDDNRMVEMMQLIGQLYDCQGKSERIKNTPFPQQITYFGRLFTWVFIFLLPLAYVDYFTAHADAENLTGLVANEYVFTMVPFVTLISWLFFLLEKVSESCEDPFEWGSTDVPIAAISRTIEIDLLEMIGETFVPKPVQPIRGIMF